MADTADELTRLRAENTALRARAEVAEARLAPIEALAREIAPLHEAATAGPWKMLACNEDWTAFDLVYRDEAGKAFYVASDILGIDNAHLIAFLRNNAATIIAAGAGHE